MDSGSITIILVLALLVLMSAYFSATETAFSCFNKIRMKNMAADGSRRAELVLSLSENYDKLLSTILIGNNIVNIAAASLATIVFTRYLGNSGVTISTVVMTIVVLIFGEISPKSLAKESPERFALFSAPILRFFTYLLLPLNWLFGQWKKLLSRIFRVAERPGITEDELITYVEEAESEGEIDSHESKLIRSAIEFNDLDVDEIITPRVDVVSVSETDTKEEIRDVFLTHGFSRLPVYRGNVDNIIGVIHEKDLFALINGDYESLDEIINPIVCVTPNMKISALLRRLQQAKTHMAVVVDEYGGTMGIATLEDVLEELVGDIYDEHDEVIEHFHKISENTYRISGAAELEDLIERFQLHCDTDDYDAVTVSGWVVQETGGLPNVGDRFQFENLQVTVTKTDSRRVQEIEVCVLAQEPSE